MRFKKKFMVYFLLAALISSTFEWSSSIVYAAMQEEIDTGDENLTQNMKAEFTPASGAGQMTDNRDKIFSKDETDMGVDQEGKGLESGRGQDNQDGNQSGTDKNGADQSGTNQGVTGDDQDTTGEKEGVDGTAEKAEEEDDGQKTEDDLTEEEKKKTEEEEKAEQEVPKVTATFALMKATLAGEVELTEAVFPDASLRGIVGSYDEDASGGLSEEEIRKITALIYPNSGITDITGLEKLTSLTHLDLSGNSITSLTGLEQLTELTHLDLSNTGTEDYTALSYLPNLVQLKLDGNRGNRLQLTARSLQTLSCKNSGLTSLEITNLSALKELWLEGNALTALNLTGLTGLESLSVQKNQMSMLDATPCTSLKVLQADNNNLISLQVNGLSGLLQLDCQKNRLTALEVSGLTALQQLNVSDNELTELDISGLTALETVLAGNNRLSGEWNAAGARLVSLEGNQINAMSEGGSLRYLNVRNNALTALYLNSPTLERLYCSRNALTSLNVENPGSLSTVYCDNNHLPYMETAQAIDLCLSPQLITMTRTKKGTQHTTDMKTVLKTAELLGRTEVVQEGMIISVEGGIVTFSGAEASMQYNYTASTDTNATMLVKVKLTEVDQTPEEPDKPVISNPPSGGSENTEGTAAANNGGTGTTPDGGNAGGRNTAPTENPTSAANPALTTGTTAVANNRMTGGTNPTREWPVLARTEMQRPADYKVPVVELNSEGEAISQRVFDENGKEYLLVNTRLDEQQQEEVRQLLDNHDGVQKAWTGMENYKWVDIYLSDSVLGNQVQPSGRVTFVIRYPEGTHKDYVFTIVHVEGGNSPVVLVEGIDYIREEEGFVITVDSFSPFIISWKEVAEEEDTSQISVVQETEEKPQNIEEAKEKGGFLWFVIVLVLLSVAAGYYWYNRKNKQKEN